MMTKITTKQAKEARFDGYVGNASTTAWEKGGRRIGYDISVASYRLNDGSIFVQVESGGSLCQKYGRIIFKDVHEYNDWAGAEDVFAALNQFGLVTCVRYSQDIDED